MTGQPHSADPEGWARFAATYGVGDVVDGRVVQVMPFGSFVRTAEGVDGLAPRADWPAVPELDAPVRARIAAIDDETRRFSLIPA
jgi:ribosomal protein S1